MVLKIRIIVFSEDKPATNSLNLPISKEVVAGLPWPPNWPLFGGYCEVCCCSDCVGDNQ